jgi:anti-sigma factor RsiW
MMTEQHLSPGDLEAFVIDALDAARAAEVEAHVVACPVCSAALAREAELELSLVEVAHAVPHSRSGLGNERRPQHQAASVSERSGTARPRPAVQPSKPASRLGFAVVAAGTLSLAAAWVLLLMPVGRTQPVEPDSYTAAGDATTAALDGRNLDPLDGG